MDDDGYLVIRGKKTWFHADKQWSPTATARKTSSGMIVGQVVQPFSGAYSGELSWTFVHTNGKTYVADYSEPFKTVGDSVCLSPRPVSQPVFCDNGVAKVFQKGKFRLVGTAFRLTEFDGQTVKGYFLCDSAGKPASLMLTEWEGKGVYAQWFSWKDGKQRLGQKIAVKSNGTSPIWP